MDECVHASMNTVYSLITAECGSSLQCLCVHMSIGIYDTEQYQMLSDNKQCTEECPPRIKMVHFPVLIEIELQYSLFSVVFNC